MVVKWASAIHELFSFICVIFEWHVPQPIYIYTYILKLFCDFIKSNEYQFSSPSNGPGDLPCLSVSFLYLIIPGKMTPHMIDFF